MKKKIIITSSVVGGLAVLGTTFYLGKEYGVKNIIDTLIYLAEEGHNSMDAIDKKTGRIFELKAECLGD